MKSLLTIGECMLELRSGSNTSFDRSYAGDTYNSAIYAKRWYEELSVSFCTAIGIDAISNHMLIDWQNHNIDCSLVLRNTNRLPGIYSISIDSQGERSFDYWRNQSAATQLMPMLAEQGGSSFLGTHDIMYISGISFAILSDEDKHAFLDLLKQQRAKGTKIAYDPNYRSRMWRNTAHARQWNDQVYAISDIVFPGLEDHTALYQHKHHSDIQQYLNEFKVTETVIKCDSAGVYAYTDNSLVVHEKYTPAPKQVDSTAAGDSFAGIYLASRLMNCSIEKSVKAAMGVAGLVVQHKGAIMPLYDFEKYKLSLE